MTHKRGAIAWMAKNKVAANILMLIFLIGGFYSALTIKKEVFPAFDLDIVTVSIPYPGATPEEVDKSIIRAVEESVQNISGIKEITSTANEGSANIVLEIEEGEDRQRIFQEIKQEVDSISTLPLNAEEPNISLNTRDRRVVDIAIYGAVDEIVLREYAESLRDRLLLNSSISKAELDDVKGYEVKISFDNSNIEKYGLSLKEIANKIEKEAVELSGGTIKSKGGEILLRVDERRDFAKEFENIVIKKSSNGSVLYLSDIATVEDGFDESDIATTYNGKNAIDINIYRSGNNSPIEVSDAVKETIAEFNTELPESIKVDLNSDMSDIYRARLNLLLKNAIIGLVLVMIVLGAFLEFRLAFWVSLGIPISFLGAMLFLPQLDVSINMVSMFAFIITLGIVVDDAILAGENIYEYRQRGMDHVSAAIEGAKDIAVPLSFAIITNLVAFAPLLFVPGMMGKFFSVIPFVVFTVFIISWIEALFILPNHLAFSKKGHDGKISGFLYENQQKVAKWLDGFVIRRYKPSIEFALRHRFLTLAVALATLTIMIGYAQSGRLGFSLMPKVESDKAYVEVKMPVGSTMEDAKKIHDKIIQSGVEVVENVGGELLEGYLGAISENSIRVTFYLTEYDVRPISTAEFNDLWRKQAGALSGVEYVKFKSDIGGPGGNQASLGIELSHSNERVLDEASSLLAEELGHIGGVSDINDGFTPGKKEFEIELLPLAHTLGVSAIDIASQIRESYYGAEALRQQRGRNEVKVMVRLPEEQRESRGSIYKLKVKTENGYIPLEKLANIKEGRSYTQIVRKDGRRVITVEANITPESDTPKVLEKLQADVFPKLDRFAGLSLDYGGKSADAQESMISLAQGFLITLAVIYITLALPLQSYYQPIIVMASIPFGVVGAFLGHLLMGYSLSVVSVMGVVALAGVVINNSLVLIDYANRRIKEGQTPYEAIVNAGVRRFRPIILTTMTTFVGLAPMIFETSIQARFMIPMAISLGYGMVFATAITLIIIPTMYLVFEDFKGRSVKG
jgi:multidrug efflux pump subunit AcrB